MRKNAVVAIEISKVYNFALSNPRPGIPRDNLHFCSQSAFIFEGKKPCLQERKTKVIAMFLMIMKLLVNSFLVVKQNKE